LPWTKSKFLPPIEIIKNNRKLLIISGENNNDNKFDHQAGEKSRRNEKLQPFKQVNSSVAGELQCLPSFAI
jgi:hypothetical protein